VNKVTGASRSSFW